MTRGKIAILLSLFALLSLFSILTLFSSHQLPAEREIVTSLYTYEETGLYDYRANLQSNIIYDNQTTLKPGQGIIYTEITESLDTFFNYTFQGDHNANITITHNVDVSLVSRQWRKNIYTIPAKTQNYTGTTAQFLASFAFDIESVETLKSTLVAETRTSVSDYNVTITPYIVTTAKVEVDNQILTITLPPFTPSLSYTIQHDDISTSSLEYARPGARTHSQIVYLAWVMNQRYAAYGFSVASFAGLAITTWAFMKTRPPTRKPEKPIEELISPFQEIIAESAEEPQFKEHHLMPTTTIFMKTLDDLIKVADWLGKPVLSHQETKRSKGTKSTRVFYVLDGTTRYEYLITAPSIAGEEGETKEVEIRENGD